MKNQGETMKALQDAAMVSRLRAKQRVVRNRYRVEIERGDPPRVRLFWGDLLVASMTLDQALAIADEIRSFDISGLRMLEFEADPATGAFRACCPSCDATFRTVAEVRAHECGKKEGERGI